MINSLANTHILFKL